MLAGYYAQWGTFLCTSEAKQGGWVYNEVIAFLSDNNYPVGAYTLIKAYPSLAGGLNILVTSRLNAAYAYFQQHIKNDLRQHQLECFREFLEKNLSLLLPDVIISNEKIPASLRPQVPSAIQRLFEENGLSTDILFEAEIITTQSSIVASETTDIDTIIEKLQTIVEQRKAEQSDHQKITETHSTLYADSRVKSDDLCSLGCTIT
jgi:hypothetical protein